MDGDCTGMSNRTLPVSSSAAIRIKRVFSTSEQKCSVVFSVSYLCCPCREEEQLASVLFIIPFQIGEDSYVCLQALFHSRLNNSRSFNLPSKVLFSVSLIIQVLLWNPSSVSTSSLEEGASDWTCRLARVSLSPNSLLWGGEGALPFYVTLPPM